MRFNLRIHIKQADNKATLWYYHTLRGSVLLPSRDMSGWVLKNLTILSYTTSTQGRREKFEPFPLEISIPRSDQIQRLCGESPFPFPLERPAGKMPHKFNKNHD